ncbi:unnamed protein product [Vitrella brassicaformis CCMP3155]|uniref:RRM domain-containing protein n=1 Tax=Vitrella brassicaformis (strain CCMP3155) TaxID=1169540 RepID=A0A0G4GEM7_VITBC|nr:unnamed protein product [Vitrella brassicaformis CCMP3155]|eukprot:CEM27845.1 unnamed protein product [Vitrella brassicaformis CCMP3155]
MMRGGVRVDRVKLFLGGLSHTTTEDDIHHHFTHFAKCYRAVVKRDLRGKPRGFGFVVLSKEGAQVFVGHLPLSASVQQLERYFANFGSTVEQVTIIRGEDGRSKGFGFVTLKDWAAWVEVKRATPQNELKLLPGEMRHQQPHSHSHAQAPQHDWRTGATDDNEKDNEAFEYQSAVSLLDEHNQVPEDAFESSAADVLSPPPGFEDVMIPDTAQVHHTQPNHVQADSAKTAVDDGAQQLCKTDANQPTCGAVKGRKSDESDKSKASSSGLCSSSRSSIVTPIPNYQPTVQECLRLLKSAIEREASGGDAHRPPTHLTAALISTCTALLDQMHDNQHTHE